MDCLSKCVHIFDCGENVRTPHGAAVHVGPKPGKIPPEDIHRAILITVHHEATFSICTAISPFPEWHVLLMSTCPASFGSAHICYRSWKLYINRSQYSYLRLHL